MMLIEKNVDRARKTGTNSIYGIPNPAVRGWPLICVVVGLGRRSVELRSIGDGVVCRRAVLR